MIKPKYTFIILIIIVIFAVSDRVNCATEPEDALCGPKSLLAVCETFGIPATLEEICDLSDYNDRYGTSFLNLYKAAVQKGLPTVPLKADMSRLCAFKDPVIAFVDGNHFMVVHGCNNGDIIIQNPPGKKEKVPVDTFREKWNGELLVFSKELNGRLSPQIREKVKPPEGAMIVFPEMVHDFGIVNEGTVLSHSFPFTNIGADSLKFSVRSSCTCTSAELPRQIIPPGGNGIISLEFDTQGKHGPSAQRLDVRTNIPGRTWIKLELNAIVKSSVKTIPERIWIDAFSPGKDIVKEIFVIDPGDNSLEVIKIDAPPGIISDIKPMIRHTDTINAIPVTMTFPVESLVHMPDMNIVIHTNNAAAKELVVPVSSEIPASIHANPPVIFFAEEKKGVQRIREIELACTDYENIDSIKTSVESPYIITEIVKNERESKYRMKATLKEVPPETTINESILIYTNGSTVPSLSIPVYAVASGNDNK